MDRLLSIITWLSIILIAGVLTSVRKQHIRVESSVSWLAAALLLLLLAQSKSALEKVAEIIGAENAVTALFFAAAIVFVLVIYRVSIRVSALKDSNIALTQRIAILEYRLEQQEMHEKK